MQSVRWERYFSLNTLSRNAITVKYVSNFRYHNQITEEVVAFLFSFLVFLFLSSNTSDFIIKSMISFISGALLKEKHYCKFMLKHETKNYFWQLAKTLSVCFLSNTVQTDLVFCNYIWLEQLNSRVKCRLWNSFRWNYLFH